MENWIVEFIKDWWFRVIIFYVVVGFVWGVVANTIDNWKKNKFIRIKDLFSVDEEEKCASYSSTSNNWCSGVMWIIMVFVYALIKLLEMYGDIWDRWVGFYNKHFKETVDKILSFEIVTDDEVKDGDEIQEEKQATQT